MDIQDCMTAEETRIAMLDNENTVMLSELILCSWPSIKAEVQKDMQPFLSYRDDIIIIDHADMRCRRKITPVAQQDKH